MKNKIKKVPTYPWETIILSALTIAGFIFFFITNLLDFQTKNQQFILLANSFLHGKVYFIPVLDAVYDAALFNNHYYWPLGPFPGVLFMPLVALFGTHISQGYIQFPLILISSILLFRIALAITQNKKTSWWLTIGYTLASAFMGVAMLPWSWQCAQVVANTCLLVALHEYFCHKRWILIGLFMGLAIATRLNLILGTIFFFIMIIYKQASWRKKVTELALFVTPIILSIITLLIYNRLRFHNFFDQGYGYQMLPIADLAANRSHGLWSFIHIPANIFYFLFQGLVPVFTPQTKILTFPFLTYDGWGMSILLTSPFFVWIKQAPWKNPHVIAASISASMLAFAIFGYYGIGLKQFGYRYALDFYPFLFVILCFAMKKSMSNLMKTIITLSALLNGYLLMTSSPK